MVIRVYLSWRAGWVERQECFYIFLFPPSGVLSSFSVSDHLFMKSFYNFFISVQRFFSSCFLTRARPFRFACQRITINWTRIFYRQCTINFLRQRLLKKGALTGRTNGRRSQIVPVQIIQIIPNNKI